MFQGVFDSRDRLNSRSYKLGGVAEAVRQSRQFSDIRIPACYRSPILFLFRYGIVLYDVFIQYHVPNIGEQF